MVLAASVRRTCRHAFCHGVGYHAQMTTCRECKDEVEELVKVRIGGRTQKLCEDCADRAREEAEIAEQSESVIQDMMGFRGRR